MLTVKDQKIVDLIAKMTAVDSTERQRMIKRGAEHIALLKDRIRLLKAQTFPHDLNRKGYRTGRKKREHTIKQVRKILTRFETFQAALVSVSR